MNLIGVNHRKPNDVGPTRAHFLPGTREGRPGRGPPGCERWSVLERFRTPGLHRGPGRVGSRSRLRSRGHSSDVTNVTEELVRDADLGSTPRISLVGGRRFNWLPATPGPWRRREPAPRSAPSLGASSAQLTRRRRRREARSAVWVLLAPVRTGKTAFPRAAPRQKRGLTAPHPSSPPHGPHAHCPLYTAPCPCVRLRQKSLETGKELSGRPRKPEDTAECPPTPGARVWMETRSRSRYTRGAGGNSAPAPVACRCVRPRVPAWTAPMRRLCPGTGTARELPVSPGRAGCTGKPRAGKRELGHRWARPRGGAGAGRPRSVAGSSGTPRPGTCTLRHGHHRGQNLSQGEQPELRLNGLRREGYPA